MLASSGVTTDRNADFGTVKILISSITSNIRNSQVWAVNAQKMSAKKGDFDHQIMEKNTAIKSGFFGQCPNETFCVSWGNRANSIFLHIRVRTLKMQRLWEFVGENICGNLTKSLSGLELRTTSCYLFDNYL